MIATLYRKGSAHRNHNEDCLFLGELGDLHVAAVMDGCSGGKESVFASHLLKKALRACLAEDQRNQVYPTDIQHYIKSLILRIHARQRNIKLQLDLAIHELESTLILAVVREKEAWVQAAGDGLICFDNNIIDIDQNNRPKYLAHYSSIDKLIASLNSYHQKFEDNFAISTDGLQAFFSEGNKRKDLKELFMVDNWLISNPSCLERKFNILTEERFEKQRARLFNMDQVNNYDDISLIRFTPN